MSLLGPRITANVMLNSIHEIRIEFYLRRKLATIFSFYFPQQLRGIPYRLWLPSFLTFQCIVFNVIIVFYEHSLHIIFLQLLFILQYIAIFSVSHPLQTICKNI